MNKRGNIMTNEEIDIRLKLLAEAIPQYAMKLIKENNGQKSILIELELMNMNLLAVWTMLGEIAKRLPETVKQEE
jgi:hypothetical protein